jgi:hypothetical protein
LTVQALRRHLLCGLFFLLPLFVWPRWGDSVREPKFYLLWATGALFLVLQVAEPRKTFALWARVPWSALFFLFYVIVHSLFFQSAWQAAWNGFLLLATLAIALEFLALGENAELDSAMRWLAYINIFYGCLQIADIDFLFSSTQLRIAHTPSGFMGHHTLYGPLMLMLMAYHLPRKAHKTALACLLMALATRSAVTVFSAVICGVVYFWLHRKYLTVWLMSMSALLVGALGFLNRESFTFFSDTGRLTAWRLVFLESLDAPWLGHGFDSFAKFFAFKFQLILVRPWNQAHQEILQLFFELGLVGVFFAYWIFADFAIGARKRDLTPHAEAWLLVCVVGLANSLANFSFHIAPLALFTLCGWLLVGSSQ